MKDARVAGDDADEGVLSNALPETRLALESFLTTARKHSRAAKLRKACTAPYSHRTPRTALPRTPAPVLPAFVAPRS